MGNQHAKAQAKGRAQLLKKQVHWRAAERPGAPGKPQLVGDPNATPDVVTIRWERPQFDGGSPITGYLVEHRRTGSPHWVRATPLPVTAAELTLSGLEPGWRYQFRVTAQNAVGISDPGDVSDALTVTLQRSIIAAPKFTEELKDITVLENEMVEFVVHVIGQPQPKISWFKDGFEIFSSRRTRITTENDKSVLTIHQTALADEGEIKCTATNRAGHVSTKSMVKIEAPPKVRPPRNYDDGLLFELDEIIRLKVSIAGRPQPLVFWTHNGESIQNDERFEITEGDKCSILKISEAQRTDRGEYQVRAVNKLGEDITSILVTVTDKPKPPDNVRVAMSLGKSVTLCWSLPEDDGGCKIGNYIVEYYRIGWNVWLKAATCRQLSTTLSDLIEGSEYKFRIKAENPYGVSDPSEETDVVFIADPKRGLLAPPARSKSQPREVNDEVPVAPKRRSVSSTRSKENSLIPSSVPVRPKRDKNLPNSGNSPVTNRRNTEEFNAHIFDRASLTRELSYGIDLKPKKETKKTETSPNRLEVQDANRSPSPNRSKSPSRINSLISSILPSRRSSSPSITFERKSSHVEDQDRTPSPKEDVIVEEPTSVDENLKSPYYSERRGSFTRRSASPNPQPDKSPSPSKLSTNGDPFTFYRRDSTLSRQNDMAHGSSEFMLVLFPHGDKDSLDHHDSQYLNSLIPPPMSLSAPELGADPDVFPPLKTSASSTELLHERAFARFLKAEDDEARRKSLERISVERSNTSVPKILINSIDDDAPERRPSLRRRLSAGINNMAQHYIWAKRRHSLRNADLGDLKETKLPETDEIQSAPKLKDSVEEIPETNKNGVETKEYVTLEPDKWELEKAELDELEEEESLSEEESDDERYKYDISPPDVVIREEETYHPRMMLSKPKISDEPFEILTKPSPLPDPNFIPKPILKRTEPEKKLPERPERAPEPTPSPPPERGRPSSPTVGTARKLTPMRNFPEQQLISAGEAARNKRHMNRQSSQEEARVVADHYADLVREYGGPKKSVHLFNRDELKRIAQEQEEEENVQQSLLKVKPDKSLLKRNPSPMNRQDLSKRDHSPMERGRKELPINDRSRRNPSPMIKPTYKRDPSPMTSPQKQKRDPSPVVTNQKKTRSRSSSRTRDPKRTIPPEIQSKLNNVSKTPSPTPDQEYLKIIAENRVRTSMDYITDLAMFIVAFWLYLFSDARLAIPVLAVMVYRQIQDEIKHSLPGWMRKP